MKTSIALSLCIILIVTSLVACGATPNRNMQVVEQGKGPGREKE